MQPFETRPSFHSLFGRSQMTNSHHTSVIVSLFQLYMQRRAWSLKSCLHRHSNVFEASFSCPLETQKKKDVYSMWQWLVPRKDCSLASSKLRITRKWHRLISLDLCTRLCSRMRNTYTLRIKNLSSRFLLTHVGRERAGNALNARIEKPKLKFWSTMRYPRFDYDIKRISIKSYYSNFVIKSHLLPCWWYHILQNKFFSLSALLQVGVDHILPWFSPMHKKIFLFFMDSDSGALSCVRACSSSFFAACRDTRCDADSTAATRTPALVQR